jgi:hypothetical protein
MIAVYRRLPHQFTIVSELVTHTIDVIVHSCSSWMRFLGVLDRDQVPIVVVGEQDRDIIRNLKLVYQQMSKEGNED